MHNLYLKVEWRADFRSFTTINIKSALMMHPSGDATLPMPDITSFLVRVLIDQTYNLNWFQSRLLKTFPSVHSPFHELTLSTVAGLLYKINIERSRNAFLTELFYKCVALAGLWNAYTHTKACSKTSCYGIIESVQHKCRCSVI